MNVPGPVASSEQGASRPVFISYATADRKQALSITKAIERRGTKCWISMRDVEPGANYQEEIVHAIRAAGALVLVFSEAANNSDEIKKELSLASRFHVPVMALRIEDVEPSDAFAYELSTRQWIDAFEGWENSIDALNLRLRQLTGESSAHVAAGAQRTVRHGTTVSKRAIGAIAVALLLGVSLSGWLLLRPISASPHTMQVRLADFQQLSPDIPATMPPALKDEIIAAFGEDGVVGASTAAAPPPGNAPAYALGATIRREADQIKVIARLTDERTGASLWSASFSYSVALASRIPQLAAIKAANVVRCGLFGASTYARSLPDSTLTDYMQFCQSEIVDGDHARALDRAKRVVAQTPDFSWGWSAVEIAAMYTAPRAANQNSVPLQEARNAADQALRLDSKNSEALAYKSYLIDGGDLLGRQALLKQATAARPLACGCEHHFYGNLLMEVGRVNDAVAEYRRAVAVQPIASDSELFLAEALVASGKAEEAKHHFDAMRSLLDDQGVKEFAFTTAPVTGDYAGALKALNDPGLELAAPVRDAGRAAFQALLSRNPAAKTAAIAKADALPLFPTRDPILILGALGAYTQALKRIDQTQSWGGPRIWLWYPSMAGALRDQGFPALAKRLGLMKYWRATQTKPDVCSHKDPPPFCRMI